MGLRQPTTLSWQPRPSPSSSRSGTSNPRARPCSSRSNRAADQLGGPWRSSSSPPYGELHRYLPVLASYRGFRVAEIPVNHRERVNGRSRYGLERYFRGFLDLLTATFLSRYARRPMHVFGGIGLALFLPGSVTLGWLVVDKVAFGATIGNRPALVLGAVLALAGLQLMVAGLVAELITGPRSSTVPHTVIVAMPDESPDATDRSPVVVSHPSTPRWGARSGHGQDPR